jgi:lysophospholipase L1-like esterase
LHPDREEIISGRYDIRGEEIIQFCLDNDIPLIEGLRHEGMSSFKDAIHLNDRGQQVLANTLLPEIKKLLQITDN